MKTENVKAEQINTGDSIEVDLGMGKIFRPVDKVKHDENSVTITLFSSSGRRPAFKIAKDYLIVREIV